MRQFATFHLGDCLFGIDVLLVREINRHLDITPVDPSPDFVIGLMNLRGQIVAVTDLGVRLGIGKRTITDKTCCIVLKNNKELERLTDEGLITDKTSNDTIGLVVDMINDMIAVDDSGIEKPPANVHGVEGRYLNGVIKMERDLIATLKVQEILNVAEAER